MGISASKVGDMGIGVCPCHVSPVSYTTIFVSGAPTVNINGVSAANITTVGISSCGHPTIVLSSSGTVFANGGGLHRVGDQGQNCGNYVVVTGSPNVSSG